MFEVAFSTFQDMILSSADLSKIIRVVLTIVVAIIVYRVLSHFINRAAKRISAAEIIQARVQPETINDVVTFLKIVIGSLAFISILGSLGVDVTALVAGVGIGALAVGFAAQTLISNLISGLFLIFEKTFVLGDVIKFGEIRGKVTSIGFRVTKLQTIDGNIVIIPNSILASSSIVNLTSGKNEMALTIEKSVDIYSDVEKAKRLLLEAVVETKGTVINNEHRPRVIVERHSSDWQIILRVYVTVEATDWYTTQSNIMDAIKMKFDKNGILPPIPAAARGQADIARQQLNELRNE